MATAARTSPRGLKLAPQILATVNDMLRSKGLLLKAGTVVLFTHPLCSDCQTLARELDERGTPVVKVDVKQRRDLAKKYGVSVVPLAVRVDASGRVTSRVR